MNGHELNDLNGLTENGLYHLLRMANETIAAQEATGRLANISTARAIERAEKAEAEVATLEKERSFLLDCITSWGGLCEDIAWDLENYPRGYEAKQDVLGAKVVAQNMNYSMLEIVRHRRTDAAAKE